MLASVQPERAVCVAAHPDDEVLGAGATLATLADRGVETHVVILGEGVGARFEGNQRPGDAVQALGTELREAARILGAEPHQLDLPDNRFDQLDLLDVVHRIESVKREIQPDVVFTHHAGDMNVDHLVTCNAVLTAFRPLPGERPVTLLACDTLSSTEWNHPSSRPSFQPTWFVDAAAGLDRKVDAMAAYESELREWPHPRSLEGIRVAARRWGMTVGLEAAEPFALLRRVDA
jgi:LmbE family N-acetylglucosaminyl deacetylase